MSPVPDTDYVTTYQRELAPGLIDFACLLSSHEPPGDYGRRYLELGCGRGLSTNIHAAASPGTYVGIDASPSHITYASTLAEASGADVQVLVEDFASFAQRDDIEPFDYIVLHGIWSWVPEEARSNILRIIERRLHLTGVVYVSYDAMPGSAAKPPMRDLLQQRAKTAGVDAALGLAAELQDVKAAFFDDFARAGRLWQAVVDSPRACVMQDFLQPVWSAFYFH
jgi:SAM-dependent methyltransferase